MKRDESKVQKQITLYSHQEEWADENHINLSGILRDLLDEYLDKEGVIDIE